MLVHVSLYEFAFVYVRGVRFAGKGERVVGRGREEGGVWSLPHTG